MIFAISTKRRSKGAVELLDANSGAQVVTSGSGQVAEVGRKQGAALLLLRVHFRLGRSHEDEENENHRNDKGHNAQTYDRGRDSKARRF